MQRLLHLLFPTLVVLSLAIPTRANDCGSAINVATGANSGMQNFDANCDFQTNSAGQRNGVPTNCVGEVWFSWNPGMTNANVLNMDFQVTTSANCVVNVFLLYSESKDAGASACAWQSNFLGTVWGYTMYRSVNGQNMTAGFPYNFRVDGLDASGDYFIVVERVSGTAQVALSPQLDATLPAATNDRCANPITLTQGNGIDPNLAANVNGGNWANATTLSTARGTKQRLTGYCSGGVKGPPTEDHYSRSAGLVCLPNGNLGDNGAIPFGIQCVSSLQNTTFYTFTIPNIPGAPPTSSDFSIHFGSTAQCDQEPNNYFALIYGPGFQCGDADASLLAYLDCEQITVFGNSLPGSDYTFSNLTFTQGQTYWIVLDGTRSSQCDVKALITKGAVNPVLPVTLNYFRGDQRNGLNHLSWETASEEQHDRFVIERSAEGEEFESVGELRSEGRPNQTVSYQFTDWQTPMGTSYYRLRMIDNNGGSTYSDVVELRHIVEAFTVIGLVPNPAEGYTELLMSSPDDVDIRIHLQDIRGRMIRSQAFRAEPGEHRVPIQISDFSPGMYLIQVRSAKRTFTEKLIVR